jgi:hypothetical protein
MTYEYDASEEERAAADLLREKGWNVAKPTCPECHGWGYVSRLDSWGGGTYVASYSADPCPNGCPRPMGFYSSSTVDRDIIADGTVGMRRGE